MCVYSNPMTKRMRLILILVVGVSLVWLATSQKSSSPKFERVWVDDFDRDILDTASWKVVIGDGCPELCGWGNNELQYYTDSPSNLRIEDGALILEAHKNNDAPPFTSAKLVTQGKMDWQYGRIVVRAKLPYGKGTWPAIWMLPTLEGRKPQWPLDGEIDIMEHVGYNQGMIYGTIHTAKYNHIKGTQRSDSLLVADAHTTFHEYIVEWTPGSIRWFVDDRMYQELLRKDDDRTGWPFDDAKFHLILNLAVGGEWGGRFGIEEDIWPQRLTIDYVHYYKWIP